MQQTFKSEKNGRLAMDLVGWLVFHKYTCALAETDDGVVRVMYTKDDGSEPVWPSIVIDGSIVFPSGSPMELVMQFMEGQP